MAENTTRTSRRGYESRGRVSARTLYEDSDSQNVSVNYFLSPRSSATRITVFVVLFLFSTFRSIFSSLKTSIYGRRDGNAITLNNHIVRNTRVLIKKHTLLVFRNYTLIRPISKTVSTLL